MDFSSHNVRTSNALSIAARQNNVANLRRFLKKINPNSVDNRGWTCLHEAAFHDSFECLRIILNRRNCRPLVESHEGHTALYVACLNRLSTRCIEYLLENVEDIANYGSREGVTPLHLVSKRGHIDALQILIDHGAIINVADFDGDTPLHEACMAKQPEIVNILLHAGAYPEVANERKATPLHMACSRGCLESVKYIYPFVTNINEADANGDTPLIAACYGENEHVIQFLLEHGADPSAQNSRGKMALEIAMEKGLVKGFRMLLEATKREDLCFDIVYYALLPENFNIGIVDTIMASDLDPDFFLVAKTSQLEILDNERFQTFIATKELCTYNTFSPLTTFWSVAEYLYQQSFEKFCEYFYCVLMKGVSVNAVSFDEMPPLVWFHYSPHSTCFEYVLDFMVRFGCNVDYCSVMLRKIENKRVPSMRGVKPKTKLFTDQFDLNKLNDLPDAFYASLVVDPLTLPILIRYSLHCDPGFVLRAANCLRVIEQLPTTVVLHLMKMMDSDCEITDYEGFKTYVPSLKHLGRVAVRLVIKQNNTFKKTESYLDYLEKLPLPSQIKSYLRFNENETSIAKSPWFI